MSSPTTTPATSTPPPPSPSTTSTSSTSTPSPPTTTTENTSTSKPTSTPTSLSTSTSDTSGPPTSTPTTPSTPTSASTPTLPPGPANSPSPSKSTFLSTSDGNIITVTTVVQTTPSSSDVVNTGTNTNKSFFSNTGAVAGTFSVVGLVGLGILIFIVTSVIRRRRAEKFDEDVALAAAEAAASANNTHFDDDYGYGSSGHGVGSFGYPDTYPDPVRFPPTREAYGMTDVGGTAYADVNNYNVGTGGGAGAAGIGAGTLYRSKSGTNQQDPYHAYATHQDPTMLQPQANLRYRNPAQGGWEDPTLGGGGYDVARNVSQPGRVARNKSVQSTNPDPSLSSHYSTDPLTSDQNAQPPPMPDSYLDHYRARTDSENHQDRARPVSTASTDPYGGVAPSKPLAQQPPAPQRGGIPNPFENQGNRRTSGSSDYSEGPNPVFGQDESRMSLRDDEDYGAGRRVLKVANE